ncbi:MAG: hypothetical protein II925_02745 [Methanomicrobium sp.]|nr:hypothetical protein [Methanomicrobium sp.]
MYVLIAACVKNPNLRAKGITKPSDIAMFERCLERCRECGIETLFLPCPETAYQVRTENPARSSKGSILRSLPRFSTAWRRM